ncbi:MULTISPECIES: TolB family protein [Reichenbachiella]|uniref:WD40-like Beta Propeller Repeat n=1 Tax=Reichenbachiella agariperforans TaxID=156994 RepID=A0A1M6J3U1_REIAG|nr:MULTISPECIES: PD40 domain-containing protein [Reichenbachiella]MBU2913050.1 hypothetical protein [Reichenbachiella agariperforans]RJE74943.1 hypothetical protein BGP76_17645 [Reichenbachiella sp. MSK19-1]SHJ41373.1 WD40-like Beta Propeller Repeat [Reichenbachiella agariperforans]
MNKQINLGMIAIVMLLLSHAKLYGQHLKNVRSVTSNGEYQAPLWSPDGQKLLFTGHHNDELFVLDFKSNQKVEQIRSGAGIGYMADWSMDSKQVIFREQINHSNTQLRVKSFDLKTREEVELKNVNPLSLRQRKVNPYKSEELLVYINLKTLKLEAKRGEDGEPWVITKEEGDFYQPVLSPDQKSVIVHEGAYMYEYAVDGRGERKNLGMGLATSWMPDNAAILTFEDISLDGHSISASDLYFIKTDDKSKTRLTQSDDLIETWGDISPDGKKIAFSDEKTGKIFIADLEL